MTILEAVVKAMNNLGGKAAYSDLYKEYESIVGYSISKKPKSRDKKMY